MALTERLALLVSLDAQGAVRGLEQVGKAADRNLGKAESKLDKTAQRFKKAGTAMMAGSGLVAAGLYKAGQSAAELEQAVGGTEAVFKDASGYIDKYAKSAATNMGLSETAFRTATTRIGGQLKGVGFDIDTAAEKSVQLTGIAADLAATFGGTTAEAVDALGAAFRGEADPAERFNLRLNQNTVNAKAVEMGLAATTSKVDAHAKAQATLALILEQSADAQGQFARETNTASGQMAIANAQLENAKASLGQAVAPILADVAGAAADLAGGFTKANEASGGFLSQLAAYGTIGVGALGGISFATGKLIEMRSVLAKMGPAVSGLAGVAGIAGLGIAIGKMGDAAQEARTSVAKLSTMVSEELAESFQSAKAGYEALGQDGLEPFQNLADESIVTAQRLRDELASQGEDVSELDAILQGAASSQAAMTAEQEEAQAAVDGLTTSVQEQTASLEELLEATLAQFDANLAYRGSLDDTEDALAGLIELEKAGKAGSEEYERAVLSAEGALLAQAEAAVRMADEQAKANGSTLEAGDRTRIYRDELERLRGKTAPGSPLRAALDGYIGTLNSIPGSVTTDINVRVGAALEAVGRVSSRIASLGGIFGGPRAGGGPVSAGKTYLVGERGPELVTMGSSGHVTPNHMLPSGGNHYSITVNALDPRSAAQAVQDAIVQITRRGVAA